MNHPGGIDSIIEEITINSSAERIFAALTSPEERVRWWGSEGRFTTTQMQSDLRPGGAWLMRGIGMGGKPFTIRGIYREVLRPRLLVFTWLASWQEDALETVVRFGLEERGGVTVVRLTHSGLTSEKRRTQHRGWPQILGWLRSHVEASGA